MRRRPPGARRDHGFTMVEVLVSLAVIGIVLLAVSTFFVKSMTTVRLQGSRQAAIQIAATSMEQLRSLAGVNAINWLNLQQQNPTSAGTSSSVAYQQAWTWTWSCSTVPVGGCPADPVAAIAVAPLLASASVTISWVSQDCRTATGGRCTYTLATQLSLSSAEPVFTS
jgi:prepilin-type N-terminal cleavage/methylation domain-containing protein